MNKIVSSSSLAPGTSVVVGLHALEMCMTSDQTSINKYERYYGPGRRPLAYLLYCMPTVSPACA